MKKILSAILSVLLIVGVAGCSSNSSQTTQDSKDSEQQETNKYAADVVVIGAGGAGMTAAITASQNGKSVIVIETLAIVGGNTSRATGGMNATETPEQQKNEFGEKNGVEKTLESALASDNPEIKELAETVKAQWDEYNADPKGYFDTVELMELDTLVGGKGINDLKLVKLLCENSAAGIEWLKTIGADLTSVGSFGGASVMRIHRPVNEEGKTVSVGSYLVPKLKEAAQANGVTFLMETHADSLLVNENNEVIGVKATQADGTEIEVEGKAVVLATGGFGANLEMVAEYDPALEGFVTTNAPGALGDGIAMATAVGAATVDMDQIQIHPTVEQGTSALITEGLRGDGAILVNAEGVRFCDEVGTRDVVSAAEIAQTGGFAWLVVDNKMVEKSAVIQGYIKSGYMVEGETFENLATAMGVDETVFATTMNDWNRCVEEKKDPQFNRTSFAEPLNEGPYYAVKIAPGIHHTMGGLSINENAEVLDASGNAIAGLFAAGEVTGGVHGANRLGGNAVCDIIVFGRLAGTSAADYAFK